MLTRRVAQMESSLLQERESLRKAKTEVETAKANEAIALAERAEIIEHEKSMIEENKNLKSEHAAIWAQHEADVREIVTLQEQLQNAKKVAVEEFKESDEFQSLLMPVYIDGFSDAQKKIAALFPELKEKIEEIDPVEEEEAATEVEETAEKDREAGEQGEAIAGDQVEAVDASGETNQAEGDHAAA